MHRTPNKAQNTQHKLEVGSRTSNAINEAPPRKIDFTIIRYFLFIIISLAVILRLCNFIFWHIHYAFFGAFHSLIRIINSIADGSLHIHCVILSVHTYHRNIFYSDKRTDK